MNSQESMHFMVSLPSNFPLDDLQEIALILERSDIFVPGYFPPDIGAYHLMGYLYNKNVEKLTTIMLPDRNIVSRLAKVTYGDQADNQQKLAAAALAFAQCLDIQIEPSIAYHELGSSQDNTSTYEELSRFRLADQSHPKMWIDLALGRSDRIRSLGEPIKIAAAADLTKPLHRWRLNYIAALKISELELRPLNPFQRAHELFKWMHDDFVLAGPAAIFACHYFAPSFQRKGLLKSIKSENRERALVGAANAAWDITHLSDFIHRVNLDHEGKNRYIFASLDEGLRCIARTMLLATVEDSAPDAFVEKMASWWPKSQARSITDTLFDYFQRGRDLDWYEQQRKRPDAISEFIMEGETFLREWSPR